MSIGGVRVGWKTYYKIDFEGIGSIGNARQTNGWGAKTRCIRDKAVVADYDARFIDLTSLLPHAVSEDSQLTSLVPFECSQLGQFVADRIVDKIRRQDLFRDKYSTAHEDPLPGHCVWCGNLASFAILRPAKGKKLLMQMTTWLSLPRWASG